MLPNVGRLNINDHLHTEQIGAPKRKARAEAAVAQEQVTNSDYQSFLIDNGYVVVPMISVEMCYLLQRVFVYHLEESPEIVRFPTTIWNDPTIDVVKGGFSAMANPSSFHHPYVRVIIEMIVAALLESDVIPLQGRKLEVPYDRFGFRRANKENTGEAVHRDNAPFATDGDDVFGGWTNFSGYEQTFLCCPGTHNEPQVQGMNTGFAEIKEAQEVAHYESKIRKVTVPPGSTLIFYERLVHKVAKTNAPHDIVRLYVGLRATNATSPLFGQEVTQQWIDDQAVPKIKSAQWPRTWPVSYQFNPKMWDELQRWSMHLFNQHLLYNHVVNSAKYGRLEYIRIPPVMPSLRELQQRVRDSTENPNATVMYPPYDDSERALRFPQQQFDLHTFDRCPFRIGENNISIRSQDYNKQHPFLPMKHQKEARTRFILPHPTEWAGYKATQFQLQYARKMQATDNRQRALAHPNATARRPAPEQVLKNQSE